MCGLSYEIGDKLVAGGRSYDHTFKAWIEPYSAAEIAIFRKYVELCLVDNVDKVLLAWKYFWIHFPDGKYDGEGEWTIHRKIEGIDTRSIDQALPAKAPVMLYNVKASQSDWEQFAEMCLNHFDLLAANMNKSKTEDSGIDNKKINHLVPTNLLDELPYSKSLLSSPSAAARYYFLSDCGFPQGLGKGPLLLGMCGISPIKADLITIDGKSYDFVKEEWVNPFTDSDTEIFSRYVELWMNGGDAFATDAWQFWKAYAK